MKITDVRAVLLTGPATTRDEYWLRYRKLRSAAFVEITTDTELVGVGETAVGYHLPELVPPMVRFFAPIFVGLTEKQINPRVLWDYMRKAGTFWTRTGFGVSVMAGVEGALWDLLGKMHGVPVHKLLGGAVHEKLLAYASGGASPYPWEALKQRADLFREGGFTAMKTGAGWYDERARKRFTSDSVNAWVELEAEKIRILREHVGKDFRICMDGHMGNVDANRKPWSVATAQAVLRAVEPYDIFFFEEPLDYRDPEGYATLCKSTSIDVAGGEVLTTRDEFQHFADLRAFDIVQPDAAVVGISAFLDIARAFAARHQRIAPHNWESGAAVMQNIHAAFACPNTCIVEMGAWPGGLITDVYKPGHRFENGYLLPPEAPGLGVTLSDAVKNKYAFVPGSGEWSEVPGMPSPL